jgi:FAD/FMN-containing dehydrogenase
VVGRRRFLAGAGYAVLGGLAGCTSDPPQHGRCAAPTGDPGPDWARVRSRLAGRLTLPGDLGFADAARPYNRLFGDRRPAAVARCSRPADIQVCLEAGRSAGLPVAARSGGHSYAAYSTPEDGLVIDLRGMSGIAVGRDGVAEVGAGARLQEIYTALARAGRCLSGGTCASLGIAGLILGGGVGVLSRKFGLTCDQLLAARLVVPDGQVVLASPYQEPDLFWALRGGGGGNFGVVTTLWLRTEPLPQLTLFELQFPDGSAPDVLGAWQGWMPRVPDELWARVLITGGSPPGCRVQGCFVGPDRTARSLISELLRRAGAPSTQSLWQTGYLDAMQYFAASANDRDATGGGQSFIASSRVQDRPADPAAVASLLDGQSQLTILLEPLGAAVARTPVPATAFPHRRALSIAQVYAVADPGHPETAAEVARVQQALAATIGRGAYINYPDPGQLDWASASYGPNLPRLQAVARRWDPYGVLAFPQGLARC